MDRIDRLLQDILDLQFFVMRYSREGDVDAEERARKRLDDKRQQIADEWRAKDKALEAVDTWARTDIVSEEGTIGYFAETVMPMVDNALAVTGEEV